MSLFEREGRKLKLTAAGQDLAQTAARIESEVHGLGRRIAGRDHQLQGVVRLSLAPSMFAALAPALPDYRTRYPGIQLELLTSLNFAHLARREADIAIRHTNSPHEVLVGRKLSLFEGAAYIHRDLLDSLQHRGLEDSGLWPWIDWDQAHQHHSAAQWVKENIEQKQIVARTDSSLAIYQLVRAGLGAGFAPTMLAAPDPKLVRLKPIADFPVFQRGIWVLTHEDLKDMGRIRATTEWLASILQVKDSKVWQGMSKS